MGRRFPVGAQTWLAAGWEKLIGGKPTLPFVYAFWAGRPGVAHGRERGETPQAPAGHRHLAGRQRLQAQFQLLGFLFGAQIDAAELFASRIGPVTV